MPTPAFALALTESDEDDENKLEKCSELPSLFSALMAFAFSAFSTGEKFVSASLVNDSIPEKRYAVLDALRIRSASSFED